MKKGILTLALILSISSLYAQSNADACLGTWLTGSKKGHVQIYKQGDKYYGKIIWMKDPSKLDTKNPDSKRHSQPILGMVNLRDFTYSSTNLWEDGKIYDPENGKEYSAKMTLVNANQLNVRGFIGISLIGRTDSWVRVK